MKNQLQFKNIYVKISCVKRKTKESVYKMEIVRNIVLGIYLLVCIALIVVATLQSKESQGASGTITGSSTNNFYEKNKGRTKEGRLKRLTIILGVVFVILAIVLGILYVI